MCFRDFSVYGLLKFPKNNTVEEVASVALTVILKHLKFSVFFLQKLLYVWPLYSKKSGKIYEDFLGRTNKKSLADVMVACFETRN